MKERGNSAAEVVKVVVPYVVQGGDIDPLVQQLDDNANVTLSVRVGWKE